MKNRLSIIFILIGLINPILSQNFSVGIDEESLQINNQVKLDFELNEREVLVTLIMINELDVGYYSLVREDLNGKEKIIDQEKIKLNSISEQTKYEFIDSNPLSQNVVYTLLK